MNLKEKIIRILKAFAPVPTIGGFVRNRARAERHFIMSRARGNINLQNGRYLTAKDYLAKKEAVLNRKYVYVGA